jgi:HSP20 family protein
MAKKRERKGIPVSKESTDIRSTTPGRAMSLFDEMERMEREMERVFGRFGRGWMRPLRWTWPMWEEAMEAKIPSVDVIDRDDEVLVRAELPGVDKEDLDISMTDDTVTIKGTTRTEEKEEKGDYFRREVATGSFSRTVRLPAEVDGEKSQASFKDGLLELTLPKVKKSKRHTIKVE